MLKCRAWIKIGFILLYWLEVDEDRLSPWAIIGPNLIQIYIGDQHQDGENH